MDSSPISDDFMRDMLTKSETYTAVFLKATLRQRTPEVDAIIWEHGRRNFALRAEGVLSGHGGVRPGRSVLVKRIKGVGCKLDVDIRLPSESGAN